MPESKRVMPESVRRIYKLGEALGSMSTAAQAALFDVLTEHFNDSHGFATDPDTTPDKRPFWCGANHAVDDVRKEVTDLMNGNWRTWPPVKQWIEAGGEEDE